MNSALFSHIILFILPAEHYSFYQPNTPLTLSCARRPLPPWFLLGPLASLTSTATPWLRPIPAPPAASVSMLPCIGRLPCEEQQRCGGGARAEHLPPLPARRLKPMRTLAAELQPTADVVIQSAADGSSPRRLLPTPCTPSPREIWLQRRRGVLPLRPALLSLGMTTGTMVLVALLELEGRAHPRGSRGGPVPIGALSALAIFWRSDMDPMEQLEPEIAGHYYAFQVGSYFLTGYYNVMANQPHLAIQFYTDNSSVVSLDCETGQWSFGETVEVINDMMMSMNVTKVEVKTANFLESWGGAITLMVTGLVQLKDYPVRKRFVQNIVLAPKKDGYYIFSDIFKLICDEYHNQYHVPDYNCADNMPQVDASYTMAETDRSSQWSKMLQLVHILKQA